MVRAGELLATIALSRPIPRQGYGFLENLTTMDLRRALELQLGPVRLVYLLYDREATVHDHSVDYLGQLS